MTDYNTQSVGLYSIENARQLGGYTGFDGKRVADFRFIRSASLKNADINELSSFFSRYGINHIVDFRTEGERASSPDPQMDGVKNTLISVLGKDIIVSGQEKEMMDRIFNTESFAMRYVRLYEMDVPLHPDIVYSSLFFSDEGKAGFRHFFDIILDIPQDAGILFHCTQGKDRTGVAAAMLLMALGVDEDTIAKDYMMTNEAFASKLERIKREIPKVTDNKNILEFALFMESVDIDFFKIPQKRIYREYGGFMGYLKSELKLTESDITELRGKYLC